MSLSNALHLLLRRWWVLLIAVALTVASTFYYTQRQPEVYTASGTLELRPAPTLSENQQISLVNILNNKRTTINHIARKATNNTMFSLIAQRLGYEVSVVANAKITAAALPETNLVVISASGSDPNAIAAIVNATGEILAEQHTDQVFEAIMIDTAQVPTKSAERPYQLMVSLGFASGLAIGMLLIFLEYGLVTFLAQRQKQAVAQTNLSKT
jgi:capsular polysaccharide biosynthesis protein